jgi:hypothetical protein
MLKKTIKNNTSARNKTHNHTSKHIQHNRNHDRLFNTSLIPNKKETKKIISTYKNIKKFKTFYKKLNKNEKDNLDYYKGFGYVEINKFLYNNNKLNEISINDSFRNIKELFPKETNNLISIKNLLVNNIPDAVELFMNKFVVDKINTIDKIFTNPNIYKLDKNITLYRGNRGYNNTIGKTTKVGSEILFKNFISSSYDINVAMNFTGHQKESICCLYILNGMENVPYIYIPWNSRNYFKNMKLAASFADESEYLLPRNLKFKIIKIENKILNISTSDWIGKYYKDVSLSSLDKIMKNTNRTNRKKMIEKNLKKFMKEVKIYHLKYVSQEPVEPIEPYKYTDSINLKISNTREMDMVNKKN